MIIKCNVFGFAIYKIWSYKLIVTEMFFVIMRLQNFTEFLVCQEKIKV